MELITNNPYRKDFSAIDQTINGKRLAYLDSAATTLKPKCVVDEIDKSFAICFIGIGLLSI